MRKRQIAGLLLTLLIVIIVTWEMFTAYPGRSHLSKTTCSNSDCQMIIKFRNGRVIKLETPFSEYGVPPKSSKFPAYRLPIKKSEIENINYKCPQLPKDSQSSEEKVSNKHEYGVPPKSSKFPAYRLPIKKSEIENINYQCPQLPKDSQSSEEKASNKHEFRMRMPYGGVVIPSEDDTHILFDHNYHRGCSVPVALNTYPSKVESVMQTDIKPASMRCLGKAVTFLPSGSKNPELSAGASQHQQK